LGKPANSGGPREHRSTDPPAGHPMKRAFQGLRAWARMSNRIAEEWYRVGVAAFYRLRGCVVVFDRHFYSDYHAYDIAAKDLPAPNRLHGWMLQHLYPQPDLLIYLDAPAEVLFARKGEGTLELLERRRQDYLALRERVPRFIVVDAAQPLEEATTEVARIIDSFLEARGAKGRRHASTG
jgi:thymidylate kinase